jgi:hypothetical protein
MKTFAAPLASSAVAAHSPIPEPPPVMTKTSPLTEKRSDTVFVAIVSVGEIVLLCLRSRLALREQHDGDLARYIYLEGASARQYLFVREECKSGGEISLASIPTLPPLALESETRPQKGKSPYSLVTGKWRYQALECIAHAEKW